MLSMTIGIFLSFSRGEEKTVKHSSKSSWAFSQSLSYTVNALEQLDVTCNSKMSQMKSIQSISSFSKIQKLYLKRVFCSAFDALSFCILH